jgi:hypothetical protein
MENTSWLFSRVTGAVKAGFLTRGSADKALINFGAETDMPLNVIFRSRIVNSVR